MRMCYQVLSRGLQFSHINYGETSFEPEVPNSVHASLSPSFTHTFEQVLVEHGNCLELS